MRIDRVILMVALIGAAAAGLGAATFRSDYPRRHFNAGDYNPWNVITNAPPNAEVRVPARYIRDIPERITALTVLTNELTNGQIYLQGQVQYWRAKFDDSDLARQAAERRAARLDALRDYLIEKRDAAVLATTKALYQAIIDKLDEQDDDAAEVTE